MSPGDLPTESHPWGVTRAPSCKSPGCFSFKLGALTIYNKLPQPLYVFMGHLLALELWNTDQEGLVTCPESHSLLVPETVLDFINPIQRFSFISATESSQADPELRSLAKNLL